MNNSERVARDIGLILGLYERKEITAPDFVRRIRGMNLNGCDSCIYNDLYRGCTSFSCTNGQELWLTSEAKP